MNRPICAYSLIGFHLFLIVIILTRAFIITAVPIECIEEDEGSAMGFVRSDSMQCSEIYEKMTIQ